MTSPQSPSVVQEGTCVVCGEKWHIAFPSEEEYRRLRNRFITHPESAGSEASIATGTSPAEIERWAHHTFKPCKPPTPPRPSPEAAPQERPTSRSERRPSKPLFVCRKCGTLIGLRGWLQPAFERSGFSVRHKKHWWGLCADCRREHPCSHKWRVFRQVAPTTYVVQCSRCRRRNIDEAERLLRSEQQRCWHKWNHVDYNSATGNEYMHGRTCWKCGKFEGVSGP